MKRLSVILNVLTVLVVTMTLIACGGGSAENPGDVPSGSSPGSQETGTVVLVVVKKMAYEKFEHFFQANGSVEAVKDAFISPEINGQIKKIHVKEGQRVKEGQLLVSLNSDVIESSIAEVKTALELARTVYKKRKGLWDKQIGSEIQYLEAKTNKESLENKLKTLQAQLDMSKIRAPISGIVDKIFKKEGELAIPGMQLIQLVNLENVYINAEVSEAYIANVGKNDAVEVTLPSYPGLVMEAVIHRTGQVVNPTNRTFLVQVLLDNKEEKLKPNMMALIKMRDFFDEAALVVPSIIIKNDLEGSYLYVVEPEKGRLKARKVYVKPGLSSGSRTMIESGLEPDQQVIVKGYNLVKNGMLVKIGS
ncbi:MAG: efflux RND transporter periplasmic adaptor subunit [Candidatus Aminicenantes bacterium]|nr:efflux RND transporter periplasmic adaptor subunit [Candidatus Aminicenantes bacterium]NIM78656.1 efflux RND transporter periplasmic adaptor subunit [Candidatus Aminicenantes bacterium]NIN17903.1 efflux RND transporter periplasmic adaptor subunit [Candidatus Aminicenantes bacterium]NIN41806.1 efflux RND transporter periplasmic adaptor subunit [Candidatus Aminicenantes bacterium]NIN84558.1 efflux RND transporter periplasmic adaptor subunit [Candidatus Aminicenantes bacterium]